MTSTGLRRAIRFGGLMAALAALGGSAACASIPARAWQNGRALSSDGVIYGDRSFNGRAEYRSYMRAAATGLQVAPPNPLLPPPSGLYP